MAAHAGAGRCAGALWGLTLALFGCGSEDASGGGNTTAGTGGTTEPAPTETGTEACSDGADNDDDGDQDCADADCAGLLVCVEFGAECDDGADNDGDGESDCDDPDCSLLAACAAPTETSAVACQDGSDNDGDGDQDCDDADCLGFVFCQPGSPSTETDAARCQDGMDNDGDGDTDCQDAGCSGFVFCHEVTPAQCTDGLDNDDDGLTDCEEPACHGSVPPGECRPARVFFRGDVANNGLQELFTANVDGTGARRVLSGALSGGVQSSWLVSPNGDRVVFIANKAGRNEAFSAPADGSAAPVAISGSLVSGGNVSTPIRMSPDGSRVVYRADALLDGRLELFTASVDGLDVRRISGSMQDSGDVTSGGGVYSPDGNWVAFVADKSTDGMNELWVTPADADAPIRVSGSMQMSGDVTTSFSWNEGSTKLAFTADREVDGRVDLYVVGRDGTGLVRVNGDMMAGTSVAQFNWHGSDLLAFTADTDADGSRETYTVASDGSGRTKISATVPSISTSGLVFVNSGADVLFRTDDSTHGRLLMAPAGGSSAPVEINGPVVAGGRITWYGVNRARTRVFYIGDAETVGRPELFTVEVATPGTATKLSGTLIGDGGSVTAGHGTANGDATFAFRARSSGSARNELYVTRSDAATPVPVSGSVVSGGDVSSVLWPGRVPIRSYLGAGETCAENYSCETLRCESLKCQL